MEVTLQIDAYYRANHTGQNLSEPGEGFFLWHKDRDAALSDATALVLMVAPTVNVTVQTMVMTDTKAGKLNAAIKLAEAEAE